MKVCNQKKKKLSVLRMATFARDYIGESEKSNRRIRRREDTIHVISREQQCFCSSPQKYQKEFPDIPIGYSGHESGISISVAAVALGAKVIERHVTLDKTWKGSDHEASLIPSELAELVRSVRLVERALGSGAKRMLPCEKACHDKVSVTFSSAMRRAKVWQRRTFSLSVTTLLPVVTCPPAGQIRGRQGEDPPGNGPDAGHAGGESGRAHGRPGRGHLPAGWEDGDGAGGGGRQRPAGGGGQLRQEGQVLITADG